MLVRPVDRIVPPISRRQPQRRKHSHPLSPLKYCLPITPLPPHPPALIQPNPTSTGMMPSCTHKHTRTPWPSTGPVVICPGERTCRYCTGAEERTFDHKLAHNLRKHVFEVHTDGGRLDYAGVEVMMYRFVLSRPSGVESGGEFWGVKVDVSRPASKARAGRAGVMQGEDLPEVNEQSEEEATDVKREGEAAVSSPGKLVNGKAEGIREGGEKPAKVSKMKLKSSCPAPIDTAKAQSPRLQRSGGDA
ncbi:hypothetical protein BAUCODRAFT_25148 [Baudoinia panamericana UAMH 10762]|uniref:Uncharacterized protein n=1 Tax=Baudoinia panamericana (strain UAMH 10762) TaxID=717646 RepID=M2N897_BAUPA|nr:uncharacterized protein BAUCODRAFT_25148 [Baudoinia panamericana UAMH 10762]EMC95020.1 hypothetical protein BAUCODRAFT_25148 [Baudoinia panamericana UAMH 10762]